MTLVYQKHVSTQRVNLGLWTTEIIWAITTQTNFAFYCNLQLYKKYPGRTLGQARGVHPPSATGGNLPPTRMPSLSPTVPPLFRFLPFSFSFFSLFPIFLFFSFPPSVFLFFFSLPLEVGPLNPARCSGERCKLHYRGLEHSFSRNQIRCILNF